MEGQKTQFITGPTHRENGKLKLALWTVLSWQFASRACWEEAAAAKVPAGLVGCGYKTNATSMFLPAAFLINFWFKPAVSIASDCKASAVPTHLSQQQPEGKHNHSANQQCYFTTHSVSQSFKRLPLFHWDPAKQWWKMELHLEPKKKYQVRNNLKTGGVGKSQLAINNLLLSDSVT